MYQYYSKIYADQYFYRNYMNKTLKSSAITEHTKKEMDCETSLWLLQRFLQFLEIMLSHKIQKILKIFLKYKHNDESCDHEVSCIERIQPHQSHLHTSAAAV